MNGEFTYYCKQYYDLMMQLCLQEARFERRLKNALPYTGQTNIAELDAILQCNLKIQKSRTRADEIRAALHKTEKTILLIMDYFGIAHNTKLTCPIPGEVELEIYSKENNRLYCFKTKDLASLEPNPNIITIKFSLGDDAPRTDDDDEDDDDFDEVDDEDEYSETEEELSGKVSA